MEYVSLPPEVNSARMYFGPGSGPLIAAATAWKGLAAELQSTAASYSSAISALTAQAWQGPSAAAMAAAAAPYVGWMNSTAAQAEQAGAQAMAAASAYEAAFAMTVPPPVIAANRSLLMSLVATNILGQNTPAIATTETQYSEMWAQDVAAMESYAHSSAAASQMTPFSPPPKTTNPAAAALQAAAPAAGGGRKTLTFIELGELGGLDLLVAGAFSNGIVGTSLAGTNLARQFNRDAITDAKDAAKGTSTPSSGDGGGGGGAGTGGPGLGLGLRGATSAPSSGIAGRSQVVTASAGRGPSIGALSVPPSWATPPEIRQLAKVLSTTATEAAPLALTDDGENPYSGMALAGLMGSGMGGLAARGGVSTNTPPTRFTPDKPAAKKSASPAPAATLLPMTNTTGTTTEDVAAKLAATLAAMPGATIMVIPPSRAAE